MADILVGAEMKPIYGEYEGRLDDKARFVLPSALKKQLPKEEQSHFVLNRGLDECLVLYPLKVWEAEVSRIYSKNQYVNKNRAFARKFMNGATPVELDSNARILLPKRLAEYAGIEKDIVLVASFNRIEIWDKARYEQWIGDEKLDMEKLSEEVMGDKEQKRDGDVS